MTSSPCNACGACCSTSPESPRFTIESEPEIRRIPQAFVNDESSGMRCDGARCAALRGEVGVRTSCAVYEDRPDVCRTCVPGDSACAIARSRFRLPPLDPAVDEAFEAQEPTGSDSAGRKPIVWPTP